MIKRKTAGELSLKAASDSTRYDPLEVGHALTDDISKHLHLCIDNHRHIIAEDEFCIVMLLVDDPLLKNVLRRKFYAWPYLPKPRPRQAVFLYNKLTDHVKRLWVLPEAYSMAAITSMPYVDPQWQTMREWSAAFYEGRFFEFIRHQHNIDMPSEAEYLAANREKLIKAGCKEVDTLPAEPFDFSKIAIKKIVDTNTASID